MSGSDPQPEADVQDFATRLFDLARAGNTAQLAAYVDAGVSADLANQNGDTLLMLAAYRGHAAAGADPEAGQPSARATAAMFERQDLAALLRGE
jgi:hypothetical protein